MRVRLSVVGLIALWTVVIVTAASPAAAQTPISASIGYQALHLPDTWVPAGVNFDVAVDRNDTWSILGEFGLAHEGGEDIDPDGEGFNIFNVGGGVRWSAPSAGPSPFVQLVAGVQISTAETDSDTAFMLQPGAGVLFPVNDHFGVSAQVDYRPVFYREDTVQEFRFVFGARWALR